MKTEKQIMLLTEELAEKCIADSETSDKIELSGAKFDEIHSEIKGFRGVKTNPIIPSGCIVVSYDGGEVVRILFDALEDRFTELRGALIGSDGVAHFAQFTIEQKEDDPLSLACTSYSDAATAIYKKQGRTPEYIKKYADKAFSESSGIAAIYVSVMAYLNFLLEHPELKEIERRRRTEPAAGSEPKIADKAKREQKPREIVLNGVRIVTRDKNAAAAVVSKTRRRIATSWSVIGHYRHYKSGKVSYVHPHVRGQNKSGDVARHIIRIE